jgi:hypothetical protein
MSRLAPVGAALFAALAAWLSQGTIGFSGAEGARIAVLPLSATALAVTIGAAIAVLGMRRAGASLAPVCLLILLVLPWTPLPIPPAFLLWVKPLSVLVWIAVGVLMLASLPVVFSVSVPNPRLAAAVIAFVLFGSAAWRVAPMLPGGDEPHYLIVTQSLLLDRTLSIENVHRRADYYAYWAAELPPHVQRKGRDGQMYSVHAPGLPVLALPAFAIGGYRAVVFLLIVVAAAGSALAWHVAWMATRRVDAAWFGWAAVTIPVTAVFQSFTIYPDGPGGVLALTGLWALLRADEEARSGAEGAKPWLLHGAALALLPWFHSRFAVLAGGFGALILLRLSTTKNPAAKAVAFLVIPAVSAMLWVGYFVAIYGSPDPSAAYGPGEIGSFRFVAGGVAGLLFDQRFGLVTYAPVLGVAFVGVGVMLARPMWRRHALELLFVVVPYLLTVTHFAMWWGGWSPPARFFAPVLPLFVVPAAAMWTFVESRTSRLLAPAALLLTGVASALVVVIDRGRLAFNTREAPALWLEWLGRVADLTRAVPMWARETEAPLFVAIAIWIAIAAVSWFALRAIERTGRVRDPDVFRTVAAAVLAAAIMIASSAVWAFEDSDGRTSSPSQLQLLETVASQRRAIAVQLDRWSRIPVAEVPAHLHVELFRQPTRRGAPREAALFALPMLPAGEYRARIIADSPRGWVMIGIARDPRDPFALQTLQLPVPPVDLRFTVPIRGLVIRGDEDAARSARQLLLEPIRVFSASERATGEVAKRAVRYGDSSVFFLDDRSFPEPEAFWVGGSRDTTVVIQPDAARASATVRLRNAPVENRVTLRAGTWQQELRLSPGEEQRVDVPIDAARGAVVLRLESSAGFRPSEHDSGSRDRRFLGVWVKLEGGQ